MSASRTSSCSGPFELHLLAWPLGDRAASAAKGFDLAFALTFVLGATFLGLESERIRRHGGARRRPLAQAPF